MIALHLSPKIESLYGILQLLQGSHLNNFPLKTLKLGGVAFHSVAFQLKCLDFQSNQYKKLVPFLSRFCSGLFENFQNHEYLFTNCTRRSCDFLFIVHTTKLRRFHGNLIGTPTEYNLGLIVLLLTNQN